jgi:predicted enzyme related to lactoylglutathione lyase
MRPRRPASAANAQEDAPMAHGEINHIEFPADDPQRAMRFYEAVAGWEFSPMEGMPDYWVFRFADGFGGGIGKRGVTTGQVVRDYIEVTSIEDALAAAERTGGSIKEAKSEIPGMGWFAFFTDPSGNRLGLWQM